VLKFKGAENKPIVGAAAVKSCNEFLKIFTHNIFTGTKRYLGYGRASHIARHIRCFVGLVE
jgi:hypothetical protein